MEFIELEFIVIIEIITEKTFHVRSLPTIFTDFFMLLCACLCVCVCVSRVHVMSHVIDQSNNNQLLMFLKFQLYF